MIQSKRPVVPWTYTAYSHMPFVSDSCSRINVLHLSNSFLT